MPEDFRVKFSFFDHIKTVKLVTTLGDSAVVSLLRLWAFAGQYRDKGILHKMSVPDIELAAHWTGQQGLFVETLVHIGFLIRRRGGVYELNDWGAHQGFLVNTSERRKRAQKANEMKRAKSRNELRSPKSYFEDTYKDTYKDTPISVSDSISISNSVSTPIGTPDALQNAKKEQDEEGPPLTPEEQKIADDWIQKMANGTGSGSIRGGEFERPMSELRQKLKRVREHKTGDKVKP